MVEVEAMDLTKVPGKYPWMRFFNESTRLYAEKMHLTEGATGGVLKIVVIIKKRYFKNFGIFTGKHMFSF